MSKPLGKQPANFPEAAWQKQVLDLAQRHTYDCAQCGELLAPKQANERSARKRSRGIFCSRACGDEALRTGDTVACASCGEQFYRYPSSASRQACSPECAAALRKLRTASRWRDAADGAGFPDLVLAHPRHGVIFAELKAERGRPSDSQKQWIEALSLGGAEVHVWRPSAFDEIRDRLRGAT